MHGTAQHGTAGGAAPCSVPHRTAPGGVRPARHRTAPGTRTPTGAARLSPGVCPRRDPGERGSPSGLGAGPPLPASLPAARGAHGASKPPPAAPGESFCSGRTGGSGRGPRSAPPWPPRSVTAAPRAAPPAAPCPGHGARSPGGAAGSERCPAAPSRLRPGGGGRCPPAARGCPGGHQWSGSGSLRPPVTARGKFPPYEPSVKDSAAEPAPVVTPPVPGPPGGCQARPAPPGREAHGARPGSGPSSSGPGAGG